MKYSDINKAFEVWWQQVLDASESKNNDPLLKSIATAGFYAGYLHVIEQYQKEN